MSPDIKRFSSVPDMPAYIVLDIQSATAEWIRSLRARFDPERSAMPAEITVTGSSGLGHLVPGQPLADVASEIDRIAARFAPFPAAFDKVERFPGTEIYYLTLADPAPFLEIHKAFAESSIGFQESPYPFEPHCTLKLRSTPSDTELLELFFLDAPKEPFTLSSLSLYALPDVRTCELLHTVRLSGT